MALAPIPLQKPDRLKAKSPTQPVQNDWTAVGTLAPDPAANFSTPVLPAIAENDWAPVDVVAPTVQIANDWESTGVVIPPDPASMNELDRTIINPFQRGMIQAGQGVDTLRAALGITSPEEFARITTENDLKMRQFPEAPADAAEGERLRSLEGWDQVGAVLTNPRLWVQTIAQSAPNIVPTLGGAAAGSIAGPLGAAAGAGTVSAITEFNASLLDAIREATPDGGVTEESIIEALRNPQIMDRAREFAAKRGVAVGIFDAISMGLAGKFFGPVSRTLGGGVGGKVAGAAVETAAQGGFGAGGEAAAQLASRGKITSAGDIALEAVAEVPGAILEPAINKSAELIRGKPANPADSLPMIEPPAPAPIAPEASPNVQQVDPANDWVPVMPTAPAQPSAMPTSTSPQEVPAAQVQPNTVSVSGQSEPLGVDVPVQQAEPVQPVQPVQPEATPVQQPEPVQTQIAQAPPVEPQAPVTPVPEPTPAPVQTDTPEQSPAARLAPDADRSRMRLGNALRKIEVGLPKQGLTQAKIRARKDIIDGVRNTVVAEDETPQQFRIGDEVTASGSYQTETVVGVTNKDGAVSLRLMKPDGDIRVLPADQISQHDKTALDDPGPAVKPKWYGQNVENSKGVKVGDRVTHNGVSGRVVGLWKGDVGKAYGVTRKPVNVAFVPDGKPDGVYRMASTDTVQKDYRAETPAAPEPAPKAEGKRDIRFKKFDPEEGGPSKGHQRATLPDGRTIAFWKNEGSGGTSIKGEWLMMPLTAKGGERSIPDGSTYDRLEGTNIYDLNELREKFLSGELDEQIKRLNDAADEWERTARERNFRMINGEPNPDYKPPEAAAPDTEEDTTTDEPADMPDMEDAAPGDMGDDRKPAGTLAPQTEDVSMSVGRSVYEEAFRVAGLDPDEGILLPPEQKISILRRVMTSVFGFRSFETTGASAKDAVNQMLNAYRNVRFMMHALGLPVRGVSLNGTLAVNLESNQKRYFGVYQPGTKTIGMPGRSNSFAHEWMHALDHYLMDALKGRGDALLSQWTRNKGLDPNKSIENAFINLIHTMFFDEAGAALKALQLEQEAAAVVQKGPNAGQPTAAAKIAQDQLARLKSGATRINLPKTQYRQDAQDFQPGSPYWSSVHEMLARAFEAYVASKVEALGGTNEFITKGDAAYLSSADRRLAMTFPKADDRLAIFAAFDDVLHHIRNDAILGNDPAASRPADVDIVDPQHWNKLVLAQGNPSFFEGFKKEAFAVRNSIKNAIQNGFVKSLKNAVSQTALNAGINPNMTLGDVSRVALDSTRFFLFSLRGAIRPRIARNKGKGAGFMQDAFDDFATLTGAGTEQARTYEEERAQEAIKDINQIEAALRANGKANLRLTKDENDQARRLLFGEKVPGVDPAITKIAAAMRRLMDDIHTRAEKAGMNIGYITEKGYLPRILNPSAVQRDPNGFEKAARKVYQIVYKNLTSDPSFTDADLIELSNLVDHRQGNTTGVSRYRSEVSALRAAIKAVSKAEDALTAAKTPGEKAKATADLTAATQTYTTARQDLIDAVRDPFTEVSASDWLTRVQIGDSVTYDSHGPASNFAKKRLLPPEADDIMADFYNTDAVNLVAAYAHHVSNRSAFVKRAGNTGGTNRIQDVVARKDVQNRIAANPSKYTMATEDGRRAIIRDLANPKTDNLLEMRLREAQKAGANPDDVVALRGAIESITGRGDRGPMADYLDRFSGFIYGYTYLRLLPRAAITAITEPVTVLMRTGSTRAMFRTFAAYLSEINQKAQSVQERQAIARAIGLTTSPLYDVILMARLGMDHGHVTSANVALSNFFQANFLTAVTNAQRRSVMIGGFQWLRDMAQAHASSKSPDVQKRMIEAELRELGVREEDIPSFLNWLAQKDTLPNLSELDDKAGRIFQIAINRLTNQIIQNPQRADKPMPASTALGRLVYSLTSYLYAFFSNVHAATVTRGMRNFRLAQEDGQGTISAALTAGLPAAKSLIGGFAILWAGQFLTAMIRESLFNGEQFEKHRADDDLFEWLAKLAWSRTGVLGPLDVVGNSITGIKYERDMSNILAGAGLSSIFSDLQNIARLFADNSPNTNTAEREAAKAMYRLIAAPLISLGLSSTEVAGPVGAGLRYLGLVTLTSNSAAAGFADMVAGEAKRLKKGDEGYVPPKKKE